jgi:hypothetical protein
LPGDALEDYLDDVEDLPARRFQWVGTAGPDAWPIRAKKGDAVSMHRRCTFALVCLLLPGLARAAAPTYSLTPIVAPDPAWHLVPLSINDRGEVAGYIRKSNPGSPFIPERPFFWNGTGPARELPLPADPNLGVFAYGMNNRGEVLGKVGDDLVVWSPDGGTRTVALPAGYQSWAGSPDLNDAGTVLTAGTLDQNGTGAAAFRLHADGTVDKLDYELTYFTPVALNQRGAALGQGAEGPVVWEPDGTVRSLTTTGYGYGHGYAINEAGTVTGMVGTDDLQSLAVWRADGTRIVTADGVSKHFGGNGTGINNSDQVVGTAFGRAISWSEASGLVYLQDQLDASGAGWTLGESATGINDAGQIIATAARAGSNVGWAVVLTPVPEPGTAAAGVAVFALMAMHRRRPTHGSAEC